MFLLLEFVIFLSFMMKKASAFLKLEQQQEIGKRDLRKKKKNIAENIIQKEK